MGDRNGKGLFPRKQPERGRETDWNCGLCPRSTKGEAVILAHKPNDTAGDSMAVRFHSICVLNNIVGFVDALDSRGYEIPEQVRGLLRSK